MYGGAKSSYCSYKRTSFLYVKGRKFSATKDPGCERFFVKYAITWLLTSKLGGFMHGAAS